MATTARFPAASGGSGPPTPPPSSPTPTQPATTQLIVLPATLHQSGNGGTLVNGVPVIDVSALEQAADSSNESSTSNGASAGNQDTDPLQTTPHFITVTVATEGDTVASHQGYHVQYVEPELYASQTNGGQTQMAYPVYTVGEAGALYTSQAQYYTGTNSGGANNAVGYATTGTHYLVQQNVDENMIPSNQQRASPQTTAAVQWLLENYETAEGVSLPRSTLYAHYLRHCGEHKLEPVNAASFGKLIRSVFLGLRTRRLGTRGNSKYHYYGIRVKPNSSLTTVVEESGRCSQGAGGTSSAAGKVSGGATNSGGNRYKRSNESFDTSAPVISQHQSYLGDGSNAIPSFPNIHFSAPLPEDCSIEDVDTLRSIYREHFEAFLDAILGLEFSTIDSLWREFWRSQDNNNGDECEEEKYLSKSKLYALCALEPVQNFMRQLDLVFYQNLVQVLLPDVLRPIPSSLTQAIRNFAKSLENWLTTAMTGSPPGMLTAKLSAVSAFSQSLRRYTSLNHLAQAARAVLHNSTQISQMLADLNRVDFHNVQEQASWVCQCDHEVVQRLEADFKLTLQQQNSLEQWASWLKNVVKQALKPYEKQPDFSKAARQFLLKWSFYSSMVIRDLTLRSAASFGSFHLIRLLYDEYMFYLIEHQVAEATGVMPIAVMAEGNRCDRQQQQQNNGEILCNGDATNITLVAKLGCNSPTDNKRLKIS